MRGSMPCHEDFACQFKMKNDVVLETSGTLAKLMFAGTLPVEMTGKGEVVMA